MSQQYAASSLVSQFSALQPIVCSLDDKTPLTLMTASELISRLPASERSRIPEAAVGAFVSESSLTAYPIVGRIADFLEQDSLHLSETQDVSSRGLDSESNSIKQSVKQWYDEFGWKRNESGVYGDTGLFSQLSLTGHGLYEVSSHLSLLDRLSGGEFVLDAASGAIPHPEYLAYSWFYKYRVCVDMSRTALQEAATKLAGRGFFCLADVCCLPFKEGVFDAVVSGYTIQHIPESQQSQAVGELYRVLGPGGHLCVISNIQLFRAHQALVTAARAIRKILKMLGIIRPLAVPEPSRASGSSTPPHKLYSFARDLRWWDEVATSLTESYTLEGFRLFHKDEFELVFGESARAANVVRALETLFPRLAAKMCAYLLVDLKKPSSLSLEISNVLS